MTRRSAPGAVPVRRDGTGRALRGALAGAGVLLAASAASAQEAPALFRTVDENGVDLMTREIKIDDEILTIGDGIATLKLRMLGNVAGVWLNFYGAASWEDD